MNIEKYSISYSPKETSNISSILNKLYIEEVQSIPEVESNSVVIENLYIYDLGERVEIKVFFINSLSYTINFEYVPFLILSEKNEIIGKQLLDITELGEIPAATIRPYSLIFNKSSFNNIDKLNNSSKIVVDISSTIGRFSKRMDLLYIDKDISLYDQRVIEKYIKDLPPTILDTFKLIPYKTSLESDNTLYTILIGINGYSNNASIGQFKLIYKEITGLLVAGKIVKGLPNIKGNSISVFMVKVNREEIVKYPSNIDDIKVEIVG